LAIVAAVAIGLIVGSGGGSGGNHHGGQAPSPNAPGQGGAIVPASAGFAGTPTSQNDADGVASWQCPLAPANRYLPARSGCVTAMRADMTGDGQADLVIIYSRLSHTSGYYAGGPAKWKHYFGGSHATIEVVLPDGQRISAQVATTYKGRAQPVRVAAIVAVKRVNDEPGDELFLQVSQISSGSNAVAYGLVDGRLVPAGVELGYGGDSGAQAGFSCKIATQRSELVQRVFVPGAGGLDGRWHETKLTYAWQGPRLVKIQTQTTGENGSPPRSQLIGGSGCGPVKP